jgi:CHAT domain-containing protein
LKDGSCLLERFTRGIRYVPNCQVLELNKTNRKIDLSNFISIQNPTEDLKYTDIEVQAIRQYFQPNNTVLAGQKATKQAFLNQSLKNINYLHLSCHGYFNWVMPLQSALLLANCSVSDPPVPIDMMRYLEVDKNCFLDLAKCLTLGDIFNLDLRQCQVVTLSACETGLTEVSLAADEYISLPSGFLYAGASNVVASLWTVNDLSTTFLMIKLYENLTQQLKETKELNVSLALRDAQLWLKQVDKAQLKEWLANIPLTDPLHKAQLKDWLRKPDPNPQPFQSPYYWAGFCAIGQ